MKLALAPIIEALEADGYSAVLREEPGVVYVRITAGPAACEDCLSPREIMQPIIVNVLRQNGLTHRLELTYPGES